MSSLLSGIQVDADLKCEFEGKPFSILASGGRVVVEIPDFYTCIRMIRSRPSRGHLRSDLARLNLLLDQMQSTVELHINGVCVASTGFEIHSPLENLFGLKQVKVRTRAILSSMLPRF